MLRPISMVTTQDSGVAGGHARHGPAGPLSPPPAARPPRGRWRPARWAVIALALWAVVDVLRTTVAVGHYEERITVVTHGAWT